mgnify:CR=1 FL=1
MPKSPRPSAIPPDRAGKNSLVHRLFILTAWFSELEPVKLLPLWGLCIAGAGYPWGQHWVVGSGAAAATLILDWLTLRLLPAKQLSWGPVTPPLLALTVLRVGLSWLLAWLMPGTSGVLLLLILQSGLSAISFYATWIEPFHVHTTQQHLAFSAHPTGTPLRLLHISDIHYEGMSPRESALLAHVEALKPDLIVLTGDYLNLSSVHDPEAQAGVRALLSQLHAPGGVYAITGSPAVDVTDVVPHIFEGLPICWLNDEITPVSWHGLDFWLMGVRCTLHPERDSAMLKQLKASIPSAAPILLLYHTPDLMPDAAHLDIDLYLAGHTHGGQLRLPLYGAIFTSSRWGKRYEMGRYQERDTTLYVSRGLGLEGLGAPRARFLAPPEIILWELQGDGSKEA